MRTFISFYLFLHCNSCIFTCVVFGDVVMVDKITLLALVEELGPFEPLA